MALRHNAQRVTCPQCASEMEAMTFDGHLGLPVAIDICRACQVLWFDPREDLRLAPASTLKVFQIIAKQAQASATPLRHRRVQMRPPSPPDRTISSTRRNSNTSAARAGTAA